MITDEQFEALNAALRQVLDRQEIHEALMRYCRGVDRRDESLVNSVFHTDAIIDGEAPLPATERAKRIGALDPRQRMHLIGNVSVELDGDSAYTESYWLAFSPAEEDEKTYTRTRAGRWLDHFERRDGVWKIARRMVMDEWARLDEIGKVPTVHGFRSVSGASDPVYHLRDLLSRGQ